VARHSFANGLDLKAPSFLQPDNICSSIPKDIADQLAPMLPNIAHVLRHPEANIESHPITFALRAGADPARSPKGAARKHSRTIHSNHTI